VSLGDELLKDGEDGDVEELAVRYGAVHLGGAVGGEPRVPAPELAAVNGRDVRGALDVVEAARLLAQLRLHVPVTLAAPSGPVRTLRERVAPGVRARCPRRLGALLPRALRHRALDRPRRRLLALLCGRDKS
jgi:hypothetical protein